MEVINVKKTNNGYEYSEADLILATEKVKCEPDYQNGDDFSFGIFHEAGCQAEFEKPCTCNPLGCVYLAKNTEKVKEKWASGDNRYKVLTLSDILGQESPELVRIVDDEIEFIDQNYSIELNRIKTRAALLEWTHHLCGKSWITTDMLEDFIGQIHVYRGWKLYKGV